MLCTLSSIPCKIKPYSLRTGSVPVNVIKIMLKPTELGPVCKATLYLIPDAEKLMVLPSKTTVYSIQHRKQHPHKSHYSKHRKINKCKHPKKKHYNNSDTGNRYIKTNHKLECIRYMRTCAACKYKCKHTRELINIQQTKWNTVGIKYF